MALMLWHIERTGSAGYDTYDSAVVVAATADDARLCHPCGREYKWDGRAWVADGPHGGWVDDSWTRPGNVVVTCVGTAAAGLEAGHIVCASFNAG